MNVEDVPIRIAYIEGAMAPWLGRQLLDPLDPEAFEPGVLLLHIRDFQLNQDTIIGYTLHSTEPILRTLGLAPQGQGAGLESKFDIVATIDLRLDLQHCLIERLHLLKIGGYNRDECQFHQTPFLGEVMETCMDRQ